MGYYDIYSKYKETNWAGFFSASSEMQIKRALLADEVNEKQLAALLSPHAETHIEEMAQAAHVKTLKHFGRTMQLYTPLYLSDHCDNECVYCGFNTRNRLARRTLMPGEVEAEAAAISKSGIKHILILTGESRVKSPVSYIKECVKILNRYFSSISIEIYALSEDEYRELVSAGVDGLTIYQEVYDEHIYNKVHLGGPKRDYLFRLNAPDRGARAGMRSINVGALLGLADWRSEVFLMALHARYLQDNFPDVEIGASIPRLQRHEGNFIASNPVSDKNIVQIITALRIFLPRLGISLSTREEPALRDRLIPLGITRMSAGSRTDVGGHIAGEGQFVSTSQFEISDERSVNSVKKMLESKGYQPIAKDWMRL